MNKEEFKKEAKQKLDEIFNKVETMEKKKDQVKAEAKVQYEKQLSELKAKRDELQKKFKHLEKVGEENWKEAEKAFSDAASSFKKGLSELIS